MPSFPSVDIGATGVLGVAIESATAPGTYVAPTKFFPIQSETLDVQLENIKRRSIRAVNDVIGVVAGRSHVQGDVSFELSEDILPYFLYASRLSVVKSGTTNYTYTATPTHGAIPTRTLSFTVVRNGIVFGYSGCVVSQMDYEASDNGVVTAKASIMGMSEAAQSAPTATFGTTAPFGPGMFTIALPTGTTVYDMDKFTFSVNDAAACEWRLQSATTPSYVRFGERTVTYKTEKDFVSRTEYDTYFKGVTALAGLDVTLSKGVNNSVAFSLPKPLPSTFDIAQLNSQGGLLRSSVEYDAVYDSSTARSYQIVVKTQENVTLP